MSLHDCYNKLPFVQLKFFYKSPDNKRTVLNLYIGCVTLDQYLAVLISLNAVFCSEDFVISIAGKIASGMKQINYFLLKKEILMVFLAEEYI